MKQKLVNHLFLFHTILFFSFCLELSQENEKKLFLFHILKSN